MGQFQIEPRNGTAISTKFKMTAKWPTTSADRSRNKNNEKVEDDGGSDEDDEDDAGFYHYHYYYRPNSSKRKSKQGVIERKKYIPLTSTDESTLETVLPGIKEVDKNILYIINSNHIFYILCCKK